MIWFTADHHFEHENIIKYENRPFESVSKMNKTMIEKWNEYVDEVDVVYVLGDFSWGSTALVRDLLKKLNGYKYIVIGSHDTKIGSSVNRGFDGVFPELAILELDNTRLILKHEPSYTLEGIFLCGHVHGKWKTLRNDFGGFNLNVGVDVRDYRPISLHEIWKLLLDNRVI